MHKIVLLKQYIQTDYILHVTLWRSRESGEIPNERTDSMLYESFDCLFSQRSFLRQQHLKLMNHDISDVGVTPHFPKTKK